MKPSLRWMWFLLLCVVGWPAARTVRAAAADNPPIERTIYVPYDRLWEIFEKEGRGVFIPYEEFNRLWNAAREQLPKRVEAQPPVGAILKEVSGTLAVGRDVVEGTATVRVEMLRSGWHEIPLGLADVGVTRAEAAGMPVRLLSKGPLGYVLLVEKSEDGPAEMTLNLAFARVYEKTPGRNRVSFQPPPAAVSRWEVIIPEPGVKAEVTPLLATSAAPSASPDETRLVAVVGAAANLSIQWTPRADGAVGLDALVNLRTETDAVIDEGVTRTRMVLHYAISRAGLSDVVFDLPADQKIVAVTDPNVKEWQVTAVDGAQRVTVSFFEPATGDQAVWVEMEAHDPGGEVSIPFPRALGVSRQQGTVGVRVTPRLRADPVTRLGLIQVDEVTLTRPVEGGTFPFAYRYTQPAGVDLRFETAAVEPRILAESVNTVSIEPDRIVQALVLRWQVEKAGVFKLHARLPEGFELETPAGGVPAWQIVGGEGGDLFAQTALHEVESGFVDDGVLTLNLRGQALGTVQTRVRLTRRLSEAGLQQPGAGDVQLDIPLARVAAAGVETQKGAVVLVVHPALQRMQAEGEGLEFKAADEVCQEFPWRDETIGLPLASGWIFRGHGAPALSVTLRRREPYVSVGQLLETDIEIGRVRYRNTLAYKVQYSGVKQLRLDVPAADAPLIKPVDGAVRLRPATGAEAAVPTVPDGYARLVMEGDRDFLGDVKVVLEWNVRIGELPVGQSVDITVPRWAPVGVDHAWGQIALKKAEAIDIAPVGDSAGLRPIDPERDLMDGRRMAGIAQAYEFRSTDWHLTVRATRFEVADVKTTSIERGWVRQVVTRGGLIGAQAVYRLRSARQRLALTLPDGAAFDTQPARINGTPVALERSGDGHYHVPLVGRSPDEAFVLELRYTFPAGQGLILPEFSGEPAVQKIMQSVYLPAERRYLGYSGPWSDENVWVLTPTAIVRRNNRPADSLLAWVCEGVAFDQSGLKQFATDGVQLLFSAVRPVSGPAGILRPRSLRGWILDAIVIALVALVGLPFLRAPPRRAVVLGVAAVCAWLVGMVFFPTLAGALLTTATATAVVVMALLWLVVQAVTGNWLKFIPRRVPDPSYPPPEPEEAESPSDSDDAAKGA